MGDFGKGPPLTKNESGHGYHYTGAPGFEEQDRISGRMIRKVGAHPGVTNVSGGEQSSSPSEEPRTRKKTTIRRYPPEPYNWESRGQG